MTPIYHADNPIDAHLVLQLLGGAGITAHLAGTDLMGAVGELPALGMLRVWVEDVRAESALALVRDWLDAPVPADDELRVNVEGDAVEGCLHV